MLRTLRLVLRPLEEDDLDDLFELASDASVMRFVGDGQPLDRDRTARWIANASALFRSRGLGTHAILENGSFVGFCGLVIPSHGEIELLWGLSPRHQGRGFATEAARAMLEHAGRMGIARVIATIAPEHTRSIAVAERIGLALERERVDANGLPELLYACDPRSMIGRGS